MHQSTHSPARLSRPLGLLVALALVLATALVAPTTASASPGAAAVKTATFDVSSVDRRVRRTRAFRQRVMRISRSKRGAPYRWGAAGPRAFDCSGYTSFVYNKAGRRIPRTSRQQAGAARRIRASNRRRGDLVFFHSRGRVYHVGIYAGRGHIWHSPRPGKRVSRERIWSRSHFYGRFRR